jgi:23S rRNA pseudouridine955/2504/2580 synthase
MTEPRIITVPNGDDGQRLDRWLKRVAPDLSYVLVQKLLRKGQIRVDGGRAKPDKSLSAGQEVRLPPLRQDQGENPSRPKRLSPEDEKFIRDLVIFDDGDVIAINKPPGLASQGGTKTRRHIDGMLDALSDKEGTRPRLVHRLDKDTSGVMLLARSAKVARELGKAFKGRDVKKIYWALVVPTPDPLEGTIRAPIGKVGGRGSEKMAIDEDEGKTAITDYVVIDNAAGEMAFVAFWPRTGRTHQIRAHAAQVLETPILGDGKYGGAEAHIEGMKHDKALHLHAARIVLKHPTKPGMIDITASLPKPMEKTWRRFGFEPHDAADPFEEDF